MAKKRLTSTGDGAILFLTVKQKEKQMCYLIGAAVTLAVVAVAAVGFYFYVAFNMTIH